MIEKGGEEIVYLTKDELRLFNFLKSRSADSSDWPSFEEICKKLRISSANDVKKLLNSLKKRGGVTLHSETQMQAGQKVTTYGLLPENLEILVKSEEKLSDGKGPIYSALYLAEPCFGTKAFDDRYTMKGLALFLEVNGYSRDIQEVIAQGGVIPHIPPFSSKSYNNDLKFLGHVPRRREKKTEAELLLEERIDNEYERTFYKEQVNNEERKKITTLADAFLAAEIQLASLMSGLPDDAVLRIQLGEEDTKNIGYIEDAYIKQWAKEKAEQIGEMTDETNEELVASLGNLFLTSLQKYCLEKISRDSKLKRRKGEKKRDYVKRISEAFQKVAEELRERSLSAYIEPEDLEEIPYEDALKNAAKDAYSIYGGRNGQEGKAKLKKRITTLNMALSKHEAERKNLESKLESLATSASWTEQLLKGSRAPITWFTRQYPVFSDELELIWKKAKDFYTKNFFTWSIGQNMVVHVSPRKNVMVETGVQIVDEKGNKEEKAGVKYEFVDGKKKILLIHNIRSTFSDSVSPRAIKDAKLLMNYQNMVLKKLYGSETAQPDIVLLGGHNSGGLRVQPWYKDTEHMIDGEEVRGQKIAWLINLPTLQSIPRLEWLVNHRFRNWHTKRVESGPYASAAVLHTEDKEGVNRFTVIDSSLLSRFGEIAEEIEDYRIELKKTKDKDTRKRILTRIKELKMQVREDYKKIEVAGDHHLGSPDRLGRVSKEQLIKASQIYQRMHGLPDIISWDEILHGVETRIFNSASRYGGKISERFYQTEIVPILENKEMSEEKKAREIARRALANQRAITVHNASDQKDLFKLLLRPYAEQVLQNGGQLALTSGNHYNKSQPESDEAVELANQFDEGYRNNGRVHVFSGRGNDIGVGAVRLEGGQILFSMHKFPEAQDEVYGIMVHLRKMNNSADIVVAGDRHHPGAGYADGHLVVLHPGFETVNEYVPLIGKPPGIRGFNNAYYDLGKRGLYAVEFVLTPTLEKIIEKEDIL